MKLNFKISEIVSNFHILDSLSMWHYHCRRSINSWYRSVFYVDEEEEKLLREFAEYLKNKNFQKINEVVFEAKSYNHLLDLLDSVPRSVFKHFWPKTSILFKMSKQFLKDRSKLMANLASEFDLASALDLAADFFNAPNSLGEATIYLVPNPCTGNHGGSANAPSRGIIIEPNVMCFQDPEFAKSDLDVALHEMMHLIFPVQKLSSLDKNNLLLEGILESLAPHGVLSEIFGLSPLKKEEIDPSMPVERKIRISLRNRLLPLTKQYLSIGLTQEYINTAHQVFDDVWHQFYPQST